MWLFYLIIENTQIGHQLGEIAGLEVAGFQFHDNKAVQLAVEEKQVGEEVVRENLKMILIADVQEERAKSAAPKVMRNYLELMDHRFLLATTCIKYIIDSRGSRYSSC